MDTGKENIAAPKSLRYVVSSALLRIGEYSDKNIDRFMVFAKEYYSEKLNMYYLPNVDVAYLKTNGTSQFKLPPSFVDYTKVAMRTGNHLSMLRLNDQYITPQEQGCCTFVDHYHENTFVSGLRCDFRGNKAGFSIDKERRLLSITGTVPQGEILMEYISSGVKKDGSTLIPLEAVDPMRQFLIFSYMLHNPKYNLTQVERQERRLETAERQMWKLINTPNISEILDALYDAHS